MSTAPVEPPDEAYVKQRYIRQADVQWVNECDAIMVPNGLVVGALTYSTHHKARHVVRKLHRLMIELRKHEGWQLEQHVERARGGWIWSLEYKGRSHD